MFKKNVAEKYQHLPIKYMSENNSTITDKKAMKMLCNNA